MSKTKISLEQLIKKGKKKRSSFMGAVEQTIKQKTPYTETDVIETLKVTNEKNKKKVTRALNNLVRHKRLNRLYHNDIPYYFKGDICLMI